MDTLGKKILGFLFFSFLLPLLASPVHAQWAYTYGGIGFDSITSIEQTADGGHIAA